MSHSRRRRAVVVLALTAICAAGLSWAADQLVAGPAEALQRLADQQGHPGAAVQALKNLRYKVPLDVEADAAGITPERFRLAIDQGGSLATRLETARGEPLTADQALQIGEAERAHARQLEPQRKRMVQEVARFTGLAEAKVAKILARDQGAKSTEKKTLGQLEKQLGRSLSAADANRVNAARDQFRSAIQAQRAELARDVGKIVQVPQVVIVELMR